MKLLDAAATFASLYNRSARLTAEHRGWSRAIGLEACDSGEQVRIVLVDGRVTECTEGAGPADVVVRATSGVLEDVLQLKRGTNEPYLFGELTVEGPEADFLRLDYITAVLCPA